MRIVGGVTASKMPVASTGRPGDARMPQALNTTTSPLWDPSGPGPSFVDHRIGSYRSSCCLFLSGH